MSDAVQGERIHPATLYEALRASGIDFFTGVPDSLLKDFIGYLTDRADEVGHVTAANEGGAVALAAGHYLAAGRAAGVYIQNSGLGNTINPLTSLVDPEIYGIPVVLIIGWRGMPGTTDEPQHRKQGRITLGQLELLGVPHAVLGDKPADVGRTVADLVETAISRQMPVALVVPPGRFAEYRRPAGPGPVYGLRREQALEAVLAQVQSQDVVVCTTGMASREVFELRERSGMSHAQDFLTVGSMGHSSQIALGIALAKPERLTFCLDGDGSVLMHLGSLAIIGSRSPANFRHIVINNGAHDSVGGQPTAGFAVDIPGIAEACGYRATRRVVLADIAAAMTDLRSVDGPTLLEIRVDTGARNDLGRPTTQPADNKAQLMDFLR